jgi:long-subunit acyl-CoA synthetase (AMP-forming)
LIKCVRRQHYGKYVAPVPIEVKLGNHPKLESVCVTESGLLTPTLKIKREAIENLYLVNADAWLALGRKVIWEQ